MILQCCLIEHQIQMMFWMDAHQLKLMTATELRVAGVTLEENAAISLDSYLYGAIDDVIFILCEIAHKLARISERGDKINLCIKENDAAWYIALASDKMYLLEKTDIYLIRNIVRKIKSVGFEEVSGQYIIELKKRKGE